MERPIGFVKRDSADSKLILSCFGVGCNVTKLLVVIVITKVYGSMAIKN